VQAFILEAMEVGRLAPGPAPENHPDHHADGDAEQQPRGEN
jgi:hypothetical protein